MLDTRGGVEVHPRRAFRVGAGQMVALVGSSGAGKSTMAQLLARLYDVDEGTVRLGGVDVRDLSATDRGGRRHGHPGRPPVPRVGPGEPAAGQAGGDRGGAVGRAAPGAAGDLVASLPDGLDTVVGERGYRLSGGERQRLTIARLLLAQPRVVILDEATAHLDSTSEAAVQAALGEALAGRTAVVIAHRLSTVRAADLILVVEDGRVVERGTHADLLAAGGRYAELYRPSSRPRRPDPARRGLLGRGSEPGCPGQLVRQVGDRSASPSVQRQADTRSGSLPADSRRRRCRDGPIPLPQRWPGRGR